MSRLLVKAYESGCRFDGWSEHFQFKRWEEAIEACGIDIDFYTTRSRDLREPLPWDHIDAGVSKAYLARDYAASLRGETRPDCREQCYACVQWCPQEAIQANKRTPRRERYRNPDVTLKDIIAANSRSA